MNKGVIALFLLFLIIIGYGSYLYLDNVKKEKLENSLVYSNVTVFAYNNGKNIEVPFIIETLGQSYNGTTFKDGGSNYPILVNTSFRVYNTDNQYYREEVFVSNDYPDNYRINLYLNESGKINITTNSSLLFDNLLIMNNKVLGEVRNPKLCLAWGLHIITAKVEGLDSREVHNKTYSKCFDIKNNIDTLNISYLKFGILDSQDFLNYCFIDELNYTQCYKFEIPKNIIIN